MPILPCAKKLELVLSTAPKTSDNTDKDSNKLFYIQNNYYTKYTFVWLEIL